MAVTPVSGNVRIGTNEVGTVGTTSGPTQQFGGLSLPSVADNVLKDFDSVTYKFKFACVNRSQYNSAAYLADDSRLNYIILASSGFPENRATTIYGSPEYFIDNFELTHVMPANPNSSMTGLTGAKFEVFEPHSLGLFFESLTSSARQAGYRNFNDEAPFVMKIEFVGWKNGVSKLVPQATRFIPLRLRKIDFSADASGSTYQISAVTYESIGDSVVNGTINRVTSFQGDTVLNALETGLSVALNNDQRYLQQSGIIGQADTYSIIYTTATGVPGWDDNAFPAGPGSSGQAPQAGEETTQSGEQPAAPNNQIKQFTFHPGDSSNQTTIRSIIDEVMMSSTYVRDSIANPNSDDGTINWWIVVPRPRIGTGFDTIRNRPTRDFVWEVRPYRVRSDSVLHPNRSNYGTAGLLRKIRKAYNYLYTGLNDEILSFDLTFNNTFYVAGNTAAPQNSNPNQSGETGVNSYVTNLQNQSVGASIDAEANYQYIPTNQSRLLNYGGGQITEADVEVNRAVYNAITGGDGYARSDLIMVTLKITGDPYYIPFSGIGNQSATPTSQFGYVTERESMYWEGSTIRIFLRFRSIIDAPSHLNGESTYQLPYGGFTDSPYSGIYSIIHVKSMFNSGVFTQELKLARDFRQVARQAIAEGFATPPWALQSIGVGPRNNSVDNSQVPPGSGADTADPGVVSTTPPTIRPDGEVTSSNGVQTFPVQPPPRVTATYLDERGRDTGISVRTGDRDFDTLTQNADAAIRRAEGN